MMICTCAKNYINIIAINVCLFVCVQSVIIDIDKQHNYTLLIQILTLIYYINSNINMRAGEYIRSLRSPVFTGAIQI